MAFLSCAFVTYCWRPFISDHDPNLRGKEEKSIDNDHDIQSSRLINQLDSIPIEFQRRIERGVEVTIYTLRGPRRAVLSVSHNHIRWENASTRKYHSFFHPLYHLSPFIDGYTRKKYDMNIREVDHVEYGKQTENFRRPTSSSAVDRRCLSIVSEQSTLDIEMCSKSDRDLLALLLIVQLESHGIPGQGINHV